MKILHIAGARPQFIKAAVLSRALAKTSHLEVLVHTGQHYDDELSAVFFRDLDLPTPAHHLEIGSAAHGAQTGRMLEAVETVLQQERPDWVIVYGDTNSTLAGALAAVKLRLPLAHIEAGLRSGDLGMPEEVNRRVADHVSTLLFAPTEGACANLRHEGVEESRVVLSGDVSRDAVLRWAPVAANKSEIVERLGLTAGRYLAATVHRAENTDRRETLAAIFGGLAEVAGDLPVVIALHPRCRSALAKHGFLASVEERCVVVPPLSYLDMLRLLQGAALLATDSGGLQKEAFFLRVPCVTLRPVTEWYELVELGWNHLVPPVEAGLVATGLRAQLGTVGREGQPFGDGRAADRIVARLARS